METACQGLTYELLFEQYSKYPPTGFIEELGKQLFI